MKDPIILTADGYKKLEDELVHLKTVRRGEVANRIKEAREFGDLSENSEYDAAIEESAMTEARIRFVEEQLKSATVLNKSELSGDIVQVGSIVKLLDCEFDEEVEYTLVSLPESDPAFSRISDKSPLGKALLGKKTGDEITLVAPGGEFMYKILEIRFEEDENG